MDHSIHNLHQFELWQAHLEKPNKLSHIMGSLGLIPHVNERLYQGLSAGDQSQGFMINGGEEPLLTSSWEALDKLVSASVSTGSMNEISDINSAHANRAIMGKGNMGSSPAQVEQKPLILYNTAASNSASNGRINMWVPATSSHSHGAAPAANACNVIAQNSPVGLNLASFSADPGFAERAAKFSSYSQQINQAYDCISPHKSPGSIKTSPVVALPGNNGGALEEAASEGVGLRACLASEDSPQGSMAANNGKKRRAVSKDLVMDDQGNGKRPKSGESVINNEIKATLARKPQQSTSGNSGDSEQKSGKEISKPSDGAPKLDFIHVRARRGQATDSHSLAERVRREKISERMKYLQDLVPGCRKVTGKAVMLDEIINYVQSLQRQVEFLSMKLATVHPSKLEFNLENLFGKEVVQPTSQNQNNVAFAPQLETNINSYPLINDNLQLQINPSLQAGVDVQSFGSDATLMRKTVSSLTSSDTFGEYISQITQAWDDDLQNIVQMGFAQMPPNLQGSLFHGQMKTEL